MTVQDLIEELKEMPMDLPVVNDYKEISHVDHEGNVYYLDKSEENYYLSEAVVLG